jgi:signal transduction histidine kinase
MHHPRSSEVSWSLDLSKCLESEPLYECALTKARQLIGYDRATIFTVSDGVAHLAAVHGIIGQPLAVNVLRFTIDDDPIMAYWQQRARVRPELIADTHVDPRWHRLVAWRPANLWLVGSWIGMPLYEDEALTGMLCLERQERRSFTANDAFLAGMLAGRLAPALQAARLIEVERARTRQLMDFAATVAHELRSPLATIIGYAEILSSRYDQALPEQRERWLRQFRASGVRLQHLVEDMLTVSALEEQSQPVPDEVVDIQPLIQQAIEEISVRYPRLTVEIVGVAPAVRARQYQVLRILINLLNNAAKYGGPTGRVRIRLSGGPRLARIAVRDFGQGIPQEVRARLFTRFSKGDLAVQQGQAGVGLGLYICQGLVRGMEGTISAHSSPDGGTLFLVSLPRAADPARAAVRQERPSMTGHV